MFTGSCRREKLLICPLAHQFYYNLFLGKENSPQEIAILLLCNHAKFVISFLNQKLK